MATQATPHATSIRIAGKSSNIMDAVARCLQDLGTIVKIGPYSVTALCCHPDGPRVTFKSRLHTDDMIIETPRRNGDPLLFWVGFSLIDRIHLQ